MGTEMQMSLETLKETRNELLSLHKAIIEFERERYEKAIGPVQSPNHFLQLLTTDPWFAWLHPLSELIVAMDEVLDEKEPFSPSHAESLVGKARSLLVAAENDEGFAGHYDVALQQDPQVVMAHAAVIKIIGRRKTAP